MDFVCCLDIPISQPLRYKCIQSHLTLRTKLGQTFWHFFSPLTQRAWPERKGTLWTWPSLYGLDKLDQAKESPGWFTPPWALLEKVFFLQNIEKKVFQRFWMVRSIQGKYLVLSQEMRWHLVLSSGARDTFTTWHLTSWVYQLFATILRVYSKNST